MRHQNDVRLASIVNLEGFALGRITVRSLPEDTVVALDALAGQHYRSRDGEIRAAIDAWIANHSHDESRTSAIDRHRMEVGERVRRVLYQMQRIPSYSNWNLSVIAERMGEEDPSAVISAANGEASFTFDQLNRMASILGVNDNWLKHGDGPIYPSEYLRLQGNMKTLLEQLLAPQGLTVRILHLLRSQSKCGELMVIQEQWDSPAARVFRTPHHISHAIGATGEGDLVEVFDCLRRLYHRKENTLVLGHLTPEGAELAFLDGEIHPLELIEQSEQSIWWEDVWDATSLDRNDECWPEQHGLTKRILDVALSRASSGPYTRSGQRLQGDDEPGRKWWESLPRNDRREWLEKAGQWSRPVDAWRAYLQSA